MSAPAARASAIAATNRLARSSARSTRWMKYRSPPLVASIPGEAVDGFDGEQAERVDVRLAQRIEQRSRQVAVEGADARGARARLEVVTDPIDGGHGCRRPSLREALVEERREDREVLGSLDERRLHRGAQRVTIQQVHVAHRRRGVEHLAQRHVDAAVSQSGEQAKQHREDGVACGCHRLPNRTLIAATASSRELRIGPRSSSRLTRPACVDTLIAAIARPDRSRRGAATERTPSSSS